MRVANSCTGFFARLTPAYFTDPTFHRFIREGRFAPVTRTPLPPDNGGLIDVRLRVVPTAVRSACLVPLPNATDLAARRKHECSGC